MTAYDDGVVAMLGADLQAFWPCGEASGNLADAANSWTASLTSGTPTYQAAGPTINGVAQLAVQFDGGTRFTTATTIPGASVTTGRTLFAWVYLPGDSTAAARILSRYATAQREMTLFHESDGRPTFVAYQADGNTLISTVTGTDIDGGAWHLLISWWDPSGQDVYLQQDNGTVASVGGATNIKTDSTQPYVIGALSNALAFLRSGARVSKVGIVDRVMTSDERTKLSTGEFTVATDADAEHPAVTLAAYAAVPKVSPNAGNAAATLAAYNITAKTTTLAGHASIAFESYVPIATATGSPSGAYAGHAFIDFWASEGDFSDLDSDSGSGAAVIAALQPSVSAGVSGQHASVTVSAFDAVVSFGGVGYAGHAAIVVAGGDTAHGGAAGHASIAVSAGDIDYDLGTLAGQASSQFAISAYNASVSSDYTHNALAGHASITVESYLSTVGGSTSAGHASITMSGYGVTTPSVPSDLLVEVYDAVVLSVDVSLYVDVTLDVEVY